MILPNYELNDVMDNLNKKIDFRYKKNIVEVFSPDFIVSPFLQKVEKENSSKEEEPIEKLIDTTRPYLKIDKNKLALTSIAGIIALTGLFMNNVAIIIGAMLLSPILGPIYAFAINSALGRTKDILKSVANLLLMIGTVLFFSIVVTFLISFFMEPTLTQEILSRIDPNFIYVLMSLALGFASMLAITKGVPESTAGWP
ncbi:MAG: TIGR00341 family protein [Methanofastidiosum sp.]